MNNLIYSRTGNALQIYDNFMEYTKNPLYLRRLSGFLSVIILLM